MGSTCSNDMQTGWSRVVVERSRNTSATSSPQAAPPEKFRNSPVANVGTFELPPIVPSLDGTDNGFFVHSRPPYLFWQNEETTKLPDLVDLCLLPMKSSLGAPDLCRRSPSRPMPPSPALASSWFQSRISRIKSKIMLRIISKKLGPLLKKSLQKNK